MSKHQCNLIGLIPTSAMHSIEQNRRVWDTNALSPTVCTFSGGGKHTKIQEQGETMENKHLRIRKLTEGECYRLMGFEKEDTEACKRVGQSPANIYHQAGDSIVSTVLVGIFGELFNMDYAKAITDYTDKLHKEVL